MSDPTGRTPDNTLIIVVRQGCEPPQFTGCFHGWDANRWEVSKLSLTEFVACYSITHIQEHHYGKSTGYNFKAACGSFHIVRMR